MKIWVDADACPRVIKDILFRAAERAKLPLVLVANQWLEVPESPYISSMQVAAGFDVADNEIVKLAQAGDLVITADIPLAADVLKKDCHALNPRGERYYKGTINAKLNMRDFLDTFRASGAHTGGLAPMNQADRQAFANQLDSIIARYQKSKSS